MQQLMAKKIEMTQVFDDQGRQIPVTVVEVQPAVVARLKSEAVDGYTAVQVGYGVAKDRHVTKPVAGQAKNLSIVPRRFAEERMTSAEEVTVGQTITVTDVFTVGDMVSVQGTSKGKGFQGVVRRWGFAGGDKTHGQSDRHRAPGSIGSGTSPAKVWKGKRMAGHMGQDTISVAGLTIMAIDGNQMLIKGAVPGARQSWLMIKKQG